MKSVKSNFGFSNRWVYKVWLIWKHFVGTFRQAQILKLGGVYDYLLLKLIKSENKIFL